MILEGSRDRVVEVNHTALYKADAMTFKNERNSIGNKASLLPRRPTNALAHSGNAPSDR